MPTPAVSPSCPSPASTSSEPEREDCPFVRDTEMWFPDGNVILLALRDHAFKVYRGLLAHSSDVFSGLFSIPPPPSMESYEDCPIVRLTDHPEDLRHLLRVLMNGKKYYRADESVDFPTVAALVRLSHKYQIDDVRDTYLARMKSCFCTDVKTWGVVSRRRASNVMTYQEEDAIAAVNIAHLTGEQTMLPSALFTCSLLGAELLLNPSPCLDGTEDGRLSPQDTLKCIKAQASLLQNVIAMASELSDFVLEAYVERTPHSNLGCRNTLVDLRKQAIYRSPSLLLRDALLSKEVLIRCLHTEGLLCQSCMECYCMAEESSLRGFWAKLPEILGIDMPKDWPKDGHHSHTT